MSFCFKQFIVKINHLPIFITKSENTKTIVEMTKSFVINKI